VCQSSGFRDKNVRSMQFMKTKNYLEVVYLLSFPILCLVVYQYSPFNNPVRSIDSWLYFSYIHNFEDLFSRYGLLYYSVRFGLIFPHIVSNTIFGPIYGYIIFVYLMYLLAGIPLYLVFRKYYSVHAAILAYSILISSVWFARTVLWTHPDATAVPYLIAAFSLVLLQPQNRRTSMLIVGMLIALAVNSNFFALSIGGLISIAYVAMNKDRLFANIYLDLPWLLTGFVFILFIGGVGYALCCGQFNYFVNTIGMVKWSIGGSGYGYTIPLNELLKYPYIYLIPFLIISIFVLSKKSNVGQGKNLLHAIVSYLVVVVMFVVVYQFLTSTALLETFYYFSYFIVPFIFGMALVSVILANKCNSSSLGLNLGIASFIVPGILFSTGIVSRTPMKVYIIFMVIAVLLIIFAMNYKKIAPVAILLFGITFSYMWPATQIDRGFNYRGFNYSSMYGALSESGLTTYRLALKFIDLMPKYKVEKKPIYFWYQNADRLANSLQSTYLWGYSRIMDSDSETPGMPSIKGVNFDLLRAQSTLVLFDRDKNIVDQGIDKLYALGVYFDIKSYREICENNICYTVAILDSEGLVTELEINLTKSDLVPVNYIFDWHISGTESIINQYNVLLSLKTLPDPWHYAAVGLINYTDRNPHGKGYIRLRILVAGSSAGIGFLGNDQGIFLQRKHILPNDNPQDLFFVFDDISDARSFVISSWDKAESAKIELHEFEIITHPDNLYIDIEKMWVDDKLSLIAHNLDWYLPGTDTKIEPSSNVIRFRTTSVSWGYSLVGIVDYVNENPQHPGVIRLLITVRDSNVGFGFLGADPTQFIKRVQILPMERPQEIYLEIDNLGELENIVITNWDNDESASVEIHEIGIRMKNL